MLARPHSTSRASSSEREGDERGGAQYHQSMSSLMSAFGTVTAPNQEGWPWWSMASATSWGHEPKLGPAQKARLVVVYSVTGNSRDRLRPDIADVGARKSRAIWPLGQGWWAD